jgi:hypothetical protein
MKDLYPNPCSEGGSLKVDPYNKNYLEWVFCYECSKSFYRFCKYNPRRTVIDDTSCDDIENTMVFDCDSECAPYFEHVFDSESILDSDSDKVKSQKFNRLIMGIRKKN